MDSNILVSLSVIGGLLVGVAGSYLYSILKNRPDFYTLQEMARAAVEAAEQMYKQGTNSEKLDYASKRLSEMLKTYGWNVPSDLIRALIEQAVSILNRKQNK